MWAPKWPRNQSFTKCPYGLHRLTVLFKGCRRQQRKTETKQSQSFFCQKTGTKIRWIRSQWILTDKILKCVCKRNSDITENFYQRGLIIWPLCEVMKAPNLLFYRQEERRCLQYHIINKSSNCTWNCAYSELIHLQRNYKIKSIVHAMFV